jgi:hypothetical protein
LAEDYRGMTVNERLYAAALDKEYEAAAASGSPDEINRVLERVGLRQDVLGMNWTLEDDAQD